MLRVEMWLYLVVRVMTKGIMFYVLVKDVEEEELFFFEGKVKEKV